MDTALEQPHGCDRSPEALPEGSTGPLLDAAVHLAALSDVADSRLYVPASIEQISLGDVVTGPRSSVTLNRTAHDDDGITVDVTVAAHGEVPSLSMRSLRYRALDFGLDVGRAQPPASTGPVEAYCDATTSYTRSTGNRRPFRTRRTQGPNR